MTTKDFVFQSVSSGKHHWKVKIVKIVSLTTGGTIFGLSNKQNRETEIDTWAKSFGIINYIKIGYFLKFLSSKFLEIS